MTPHRCIGGRAADCNRRVRRAGRGNRALWYQCDHDARLAARIGDEALEGLALTNLGALARREKARTP